MDSSIKTLTITGAAASSGSEVKKSRRASRRKKVEDEEGDESGSGSGSGQIQSFQIEKTSIPSASSPSLLIQKLPNRNSYLPTPAPLPQVTLVQKPQQAQVAIVEKQEVKPATVATAAPVATSVILNPPKVQRIKLQPKATHVQHVQKQVAGTRKARRISMSLSNLSHRFTRAKRVHEDTQKKPIDSIRSYLVEKGVIQMKSRAPEKMLRSMYNDFNMLKDGQAL